jgi:hypothetical protein
LDEQGLEERADLLGGLAAVVLRELPLVRRGLLVELVAARCEVVQLARQRRPEETEVERPLVVVPRGPVPLAAVVPLEREAPMVVHWDAM